MKVFSAIIKAQEYRTRREALIQLRAMTDRALIDCNFSPELVKEGIKAWPWQNPPEEVGRLQFEHAPQPIASVQPVEYNVVNATVKQVQSAELTQKARIEHVSRRTAA